MSLNARSPIVFRSISMACRSPNGGMSKGRARANERMRERAYCFDRRLECERDFLVGGEVVGDADPQSSRHRCLFMRLRECLQDNRRVLRAARRDSRMRQPQDRLVCFLAFENASCC